MQLLCCDEVYALIPCSKIRYSNNINLAKRNISDVISQSVRAQKSLAMARSMRMFATIVTSIRGRIQLPAMRIQHAAMAMPPPGSWFLCAGEKLLTQLRVPYCLNHERLNERYGLCTHRLQPSKVVQPEIKYKLRCPSQVIMQTCSCSAPIGADYEATMWLPRLRETRNESYRQLPAEIRTKKFLLGMLKWFYTQTFGSLP